MSDEIAIIGMAGRFPGAEDVSTFWSNLRVGAESISFLKESELEASLLVPHKQRQHPDFVPATGVLDGADLFDHGFFGMSRREARWTDPQQRVFLQLAWAALEDAGIDPDRVAERISVYAGAANSGHFLGLVGALGEDPASLYEAMGNATAEHLATKVAFALRLRGEAITMHTACSTGLAVVHAACQSLLLGQSKVALAGAVRIAAPQRTGYVYQDGMILSRDGHCRAFDAQASGTVPGNGAGAVVLKLPDTAVADGDHIYAVIKGSAINNDGHRGVAFTAPSVSGQAEVITEAMSFAGVCGDDIGYVETHGTGTPLGDPIEIAALTRAYRTTTDRVGDCPIGSVKSNIGHLDTAAGIAGLIKVALMLHQGEIPPTLHLHQPNPAIDFATSPFFPNTELRPWSRGERPRQAAISSFGIGGTNVHAVLEEAPLRPASSPTSRPHQLVTLSARTPAALTAMADDLAAHLERHPGELADVAYTRAVGRAAWTHRRAVVAGDLPELIAALRKQVKVSSASDSEVVFLFPGQGAASYGMARDLYPAEPVFREELDRVLAAIRPHLDGDLLAALLDGDGPLVDPELAHPAIFAMEYALARTWMCWGVRPHAMLGHSFGEYAAACLAGIWSLEDTARLAVLRGQLVARMPEGAMLAVALGEAALKSYLDDEISLAAVNGDGRCVVSGPAQATTTLGDRLARDGVASVPLPVRHGFHSAAVEPVLQELKQAAAACEHSRPTLPLISSLTGAWWSDDDGAPDYWARQMREPVRFCAGLETVCQADNLVFLEVGPDQALTALTRAQLHGRASAVASMRRLSAQGSDHRVLLEGIGALWRAGVAIDWGAFYHGERRYRVPLPAYPFEKIDCRLDSGYTLVAASETAKVDDQPERAEPAGETAETQTLDAIERKVLAIWQERLGADDFGIHDNFLELGGNSLMAAQMLTRLREAFSVQLPLSTLLDSPTVAGVAAQIRVLMDAGSQTQPPAGLPLLRPVESEVLSGPVPLSPTQLRYFTLGPPQPHHWNAAVHLELLEPADFAAIQQAFRAVARHHDALRLRFTPEGGQWQQHYASSEPDWTLSRVDLSALPADQQAERLTEAADKMQASLNITSGPLIRALLIHLGHADRLVLGAHHLAIDGYSWCVILEDLFDAYQQITSGAEPRLPAKTSPYRDWSAGWDSFCETEQAQAELEYWTALPYHLAPQLPRDGDAPNVASSDARLHAQLDEESTRILLRGDIQAALVTAAASAISQWTEAEHVHLDLWRHGRQDVIPDVDVTRTVGWFAASHPVILHLPASATPLDSLAHTSERLHGVPQGGATYAALRYLLPDSPLQSIARAEFAINYPGKVDTLLPPGAPARVIDEPAGALRTPHSPRPYLLAVMAAIYADKLWLSWSYAQGIHELATIEKISAATIEVLRELANTMQS